MKTRLLALGTMVLAAAQTADALAQTCQTLDELGTTASYRPSWGNSTIGSGVDLVSGLKTKQDYDMEAAILARIGFTAPVVPSNTARLFDTADVDIELFGSEYTAANVETSATRSGSTYSTRFVIEAGGVTIDSGAISTARSYNRTLVRAQSDFWFGPVPVTVQGRVSGELGFTPTSAIASPSLLQLGGRSAERVYVTVSVGVGAACLSVGVRGSADAARVDMPYNQRLALYLGGAYSASSSYTVSSLSGNVSLYGEACGYEASKTLLGWTSGVAIPGTLLNKTGCLR